MNFLLTLVLGSITPMVCGWCIGSIHGDSLGAKIHVIMNVILAAGGGEMHIFVPVSLFNFSEQ